MAKSFLFFAFLASVAAFSATAQQPAQGRGAGPWQIDWGAHYCTMIRHAGDGRPFATAFVVVPGTLGTHIMLVPEDRAALPRRIDRVVLMPGGRSFEVSSRDERRGTRPVLILFGLDHGFRELLAGAAEMRLQKGDEVRARIPLGGAQAAVAAHRRCTADIAREWRVDEAALAALTERPESTNMLGFRPEDYPTGALADGTQGRVSMRITVTADGRAGDCAVVESSGSAAIDERSCRVARGRARFRPALDAAGRPVAIPVIFTVTWVIPGAG